MRKLRPPVAEEGYPFIVGSLVIFVLFYFLDIYPLTLLFMGLTLFVVLFFRDPERAIPIEKTNIVSPADGKVIFTEEVFEKDHLKKKALKVSIFMNVFNVHVNRIPIDGEIVDIDYHPGKFFNASLDKASSHNERNELMIRDSKGRETLVVQIAGLIARRIVCRINKGSKVHKGQRFGLIRFGSRLDLYLPTDTVLKVQKGQRVKAGESVIGFLE